MRPELLYLAAAGVVAAQFNVRIDDCDRKAIKNAVSRRVAAAKQLAIFKKRIEAYVRPSLLPQGQENVLPYSSTVTVPEAPGHVRGVNQSKSGRKKMDTISAAADATTKGFKGASSHHEYQTAPHPRKHASQEINITHLERITGYDETKLELECTKGGKGKGDMIVRACHADDGDAAAEESEQTKANEDVGNPVGDDDDDEEEEEQELGGEEEEEEEEEDTGAYNASGEEDEDDDDDDEEEEESDEEEGEEDWRRG
eukprot:jgi/Tetstr1/435514/TSEL_024418.t1